MYQKGKKVVTDETQSQQTHETDDVKIKKKKG